MYASNKMHWILKLCLQTSAHREYITLVLNMLKRTYSLIFTNTLIYKKGCNRANRQVFLFKLYKNNFSPHYITRSYDTKISLWNEDDFST